MTKIIKNNNTIEIVSCNGCLTAFGIPVFLIGFIVFADIFTEHGQQFHNEFFDVLVQGAFSSIFMLVGLGLLFGSTGIEIDRNAQTIKQYFRLLFRKTLYAVPYNGIKRLRLKKQEEGDEVASFIVLIKGKDRELVLFEDTEPLTVYQFAREVATYTGAHLDNQIENITQQYNSADLSANRYITKPSSKSMGSTIFIGLITAMFFYITTYSDNWSWDRLDDLNNNVVYVEFPKQLFIYDQPGKYDFDRSFYQYKPSLFGNDQKQTLQLDPKQYKLSIQALDSFAGQAVSIVDKQLVVKTAGSYRIKITISDGMDSPYTVSHESSNNAQIFLVEQRQTTNAWQPIAIEDTPNAPQQKARILMENFAGMMSTSLTELDGGYYFNASQTYHTRGSSGPKYYAQPYKILAGKTEKQPWVALPERVVDNFLHSYQGLIYSFGGHHFDSHKKTGNWVYLPEQDQWTPLSSTPKLNVDTREQRASIVGLYSANEQLFVMVHTQDYALYRFDFAAEQQWQLVKQFSLPGKPLNWQYFDDKTLFSYKTKVPRHQAEQKAYKGYIQLLDLDTYQVRTLAITPELNSQPSKSLLSPGRSDLLVFSDKQMFYGFYEGQFYLKNKLY